MDAGHRLTPDTRDARRNEDAAQVQRYRFAAGLLDGRRVVELWCGAGLGTALLRDGECTELLALDDDQGLAAAAERRLRTRSGVSIRTADPLGLLDEQLAGRWDAIVCLDGHPPAVSRDALLDRLAHHAAQGVSVVVALATAAGSADGARADVADHAEAARACDRFADALLLQQLPAEGSLLRHADTAADAPVEARLVLADELEPELVEHYVCVAGFDDALAETTRASLRLAVAPSGAQHARWLERANGELSRANARLRRGLAGRSGAAAAAQLARQRSLAETAAQDRLRAEAAEPRVAELEQRALAAEARVVALEERAVAAETRAVELEQRAVAAETRASELHGRWSALRERRALRAADRVNRLLRRG